MCPRLQPYVVSAWARNIMPAKMRKGWSENVARSDWQKASGAAWVFRGQQPSGRNRRCSEGGSHQAGVQHGPEGDRCRSWPTEEGHHSFRT